MCRAAGGELEQIQLLLGHASVQTTERYLGTRQDLVHAPNDGIKLRICGLIWCGLYNVISSATELLAKIRTQSCLLHFEQLLLHRELWLLFGQCRPCEEAAL